MKFRFSIKNMMLAFTFMALVFAWFVAKDSDRQHRRIASIVVKPDGTSAIVCLMQSFEWPRDQATKFERTICEIDIERMTVKKMIRQDRMSRNPGVNEAFFWNSQTRAVYAGEWFLFLDGTRERLLAQNRNGWDSKKLVELTLGELLSFDSNPDGSMVVFEGMSGYIEQEDETTKLENYLRQQQGASVRDYPPEKLPVGFVTTLGVDEPETLYLTPVWADPGTSGGEKRITDLDSVDQLPPGVPFKEVGKFFNWRSMVVPRSLDDDRSEDTIGLLGCAISIEMGVDDIVHGEQLAFDQYANFRHQLLMQDVDVSRGSFRFAKLMNGEFVLNLKTDEFPQREHIDIAVSFEASSNSSIRLSADGKTVAVSRDASSPEIAFFKTEQIFTGFQADMVNQVKAVGTVVSDAEPSSIMKFQNEVTCFDFVDGTDWVLVGDDQGNVSLASTSENQIQSILPIPGQPTTLTRDAVYLMAFVWLAALLFYLIAGHYRRALELEDAQLSDEIPMA